MFKYRYIKDQSTGRKYWIEKAVLTNEEGPCAEGSDWYEVDLQPMDFEGDTIRGLDLIDFGEGEIHITKNLDTDRRLVSLDKPGSFRVLTVVACVSGDTLTVSGDDEGYCLKSWVPDESDKPLIFRYLWDKYHSTRDAYGPYSQEANRVYNALDFAMGHPADQCRDAVIREAQEDMGLCGGVAGAAGDDKELAAFYRRVLGLQEEGKSC